MIRLCEQWHDVLVCYMKPSSSFTNLFREFLSVHWSFKAISEVDVQYLPTANEISYNKLNNHIINYHEWILLYTWNGEAWDCLDVDHPDQVSNQPEKGEGSKAQLHKDTISTFLDKLLYSALGTHFRQYTFFAKWVIHQ